ncbi:MAG: hypothetical protein JOZ69_19850 [Myxococcales bacterium]|nr:hypothetical protein [Myxococcales bacterium]
MAALVFVIAVTASGDARADDAATDDASVSDDSGSAGGGDDASIPQDSSTPSAAASVPLACDGALCDTTNASACAAVGPLGGDRASASGWVVALVACAACAKRRRDARSR